MGIKFSSRSQPTFGPPPSGGPTSSAGLQQKEPFLQKLVRWTRWALTATTILYVCCVGFVFYMIEYHAEDHHPSSVFMYMPQYIWLFPLLILTPLCLLIYSRLVLVHVAVAGLVLFVFMDYVFKGPHEVAGAKFKVMTNNIGENHGKPIHPFVAEEDPDIIVLQDAEGRFPEYQKEYGDQYWLRAEDQFLVISKFPVVNGGVLHIEEYDLRLLSVGSLDDLPNTGRSAVFLALVGGALHIRIFEANGRLAVDRPEKALVRGPELTNLKGLMGSQASPDLIQLSPAQKQGVITAARAISKHARQELAAWFEIQMYGIGIYVFALHMPTPRDQLNAVKGFGLLGSVAHRLKKGGHADKVYLEGKAFFRYQLELANRLIDFTREADKPFVVAGDFNIPTHGKTYRAYKKAWTEVFAEVGSGYGYTFPGDTRRFLAPWLRLDNIYCSRDLRPVSARAEKGRGSQHHAMVAELALPKKAMLSTR